MSNIRILGCAIGILGLLATFIFFRGPKWNRLNFILFSLFNLTLITVTINPNSVNFLRDLLSLHSAQRGRIITLLVVSCIFLVFHSLYTKSKVENLRLQFDRLIRNMGLVALEKAVEIKDSLKPIVLVIPAYNEAENLTHVLKAIPQKIDNKAVSVLVVDDGSEDETQSIAHKHGCMVVSNPINRGGGAALRLGYDILKKAGAQICVTMDADGQHRPEEIETLVTPIIDDQADFVIGSRIIGTREKDNFFRIAGVHIFSIIINMLVGRKITDPSSGFRAFRMDAVNQIDLYEDQYHTSELIIAAIKRGLRIKEVPVTILKRKYGKSKKGKDWIYGIRFARTVFKTWWR